MTITARRTLGLVAFRAGSDLAAKAAFFVVVVLAARRLSHDAFGTFSLGTTIGWIAAVASDFGIQLHAARAIAQDPSRAGHLFSVWGRIRAATAVVAVMVVIAGLAIVELPVGATLALLLLALVYIASGLLDFLFYICRGLGRTEIESTLTIAQRSATLVCASCALWWRADVTLLAAAMLVPMVATLAAAAVIVTRTVKVTGGGNLRRSAPLPLATETASVLALGTGVVLSALYFRIDIFLIELWRGTNDVALYNAVFRLVEALRLAPAAVLAVALPVIFSATDRTRSVRLALLLTAGASLLAGALVIAAPQLIPAIYGSSFEESVPAFQILMLSFPLMSLNYVLTHQLLGWHGHRAWAASCAAALLFNVWLNSELIPARGIAGAAWATLWTEAFITLATSGALVMTTLPPANVNLPHPTVP
jgi:O-antigen/teichoic acid export membrane protein